MISRSAPFGDGRRGELGAIHQRTAVRMAEENQRYTSGRRSLVTALATAAGPVTIPQLTELAPGLAASSAYRNLEVLERCGLVRRIVAPGDHSRWELCEPLVAHHHHLICAGCGTIEDVTLDDSTEAIIETALGAIAGKAGFAPAEHTLDLHGICRDCR